MRQTLAAILLWRERLPFEPAPRCFQAAASLWADPPWSARCVLCGRHASVKTSTGRSSRIRRKLTPNDTLIFRMVPDIGRCHNDIGSVLRSFQQLPMTLKISQLFLSSKAYPLWSFDRFPISPFPRKLEFAERPWDPGLEDLVPDLPMGRIKDPLQKLRVVDGVIVADVLKSTFFFWKWLRLQLVNFGYKIHPGSSKPMAYSLICSRSRKPKRQEMAGCGYGSNLGLHQRTHKHSIKPSIFCRWCQCPNPRTSNTTSTRFSCKGQRLETWMPVRHCQFAIQGHWKQPRARSCQWPHLLTKCGLSMTKCMDPRTEMDGLIRTLPGHHPHVASRWSRKQKTRKPIKPQKLLLHFLQIHFCFGYE